MSGGMDKHTAEEQGMSGTDEPVAHMFYPSTGRSKKVERGSVRSHVVASPLP